MASTRSVWSFAGIAGTARERQACGLNSTKVASSPRDKSIAREPLEENALTAASYRGKWHQERIPLS